MRIVAAVFLLIGLTMTGVAGKYALDTQDFRDSSTATTAQVIGLSSQRSVKANSQTASYRAIYAYTVDGKKITAEARGAATSPGPKVGDEHQVRYKTADPEYVRRDSLFGMWGISLIVGGIGLPFLFIGLFLMVGAGRMASTKPMIG